MDPDPHSICGSRSRREKVSNKKKKKCKEIDKKNCKLIQFLKVNLDKVHCFLLLSNLSCFLQLKKTLHKVIFYKFFKAGSGSAFRKTAGSGSAKK